jgi:all-trans-8'-apo-beta-carotenal 15,15'-oxygenase
MQTTHSHQEISLESKPYTIEDWRGGNRSLKQEFAYPIEDVEGEIPTNLNGTLFRNGRAAPRGFVGEPVFVPRTPTNGTEMAGY